MCEPSLQICQQATSLTYPFRTTRYKWRTWRPKHVEKSKSQPCPPKTLIFADLPLAVQLADLTASHAHSRDLHEGHRGEPLESAAFIGFFPDQRKTFPFTTIWSHEHFSSEVVGILPSPAQARVYVLILPCHRQCNLRLIVSILACGKVLKKR